MAKAVKAKKKEIISLGNKPKVNKPSDNGNSQPLELAEGEKNVRFTLDIPESLHTALKMRVLQLKKKSLKDYMIELVRADIKTNPVG